VVLNSAIRIAIIMVTVTSAACISGATYDQVRKVLPMTFVVLGLQNVKNIQEPTTQRLSYSNQATAWTTIPVCGRYIMYVCPKNEASSR